MIADAQSPGFALASTLVHNPATRTEATLGGIRRFASTFAA